MRLGLLALALSACNAGPEHVARSVDRLSPPIGALAPDVSAGPDADVSVPSEVDSELIDTSTEVDSELIDTSTEVDADTTATCAVGALTGTCRPIGTCAEGEAAVEQLCPGSPQTRCCVPALDRCSAAGVPGACIATADCPAPDWQSTAGLCPGASDIRCCTEVGRVNTCDEETHPTPNDGFTVEAPGIGGCPPGMLRVGDFCVDVYEASLVHATTGASLSPYFNPGTTPARAVSVEHAVPQGYIDQVRAKAACDNAGKRLCTTPEWLRACQGPSGWTYPYGPDRQPGLCNDDRRSHVAVEYFGTTEAWIFSEIDHPCLAQLANSLDLSGENPACTTVEGTFDMMGNLHEWVDDDAGTFRGGFFDDTTINMNGCLYRTTAHDVSHWDYSTGFRCCADLPEEP